MKLLSIIVPMYNEELMIPTFFIRINDVIKKITKYEVEIVIVNDGSRDATLSLLKQQREIQDNMTVVGLSRNFGHEPAVYAGLKSAKGEIMVIMDCDMQDPPEVILEMLAKYEEGYDVINGKRSSRREDSFMKRLTANMFYKFCSKLAGKIKIPQNVGHFRLITRRVADEVIRLTEKNRVFRIEVPFVGFKTTEVLFVRQKREKGKSKYNYKSMSKLAVDAFTSSTIVPLSWPIKWAVTSGFLTSISLLCELVFFIIHKGTNIHFFNIINYPLWLIINAIFLAMAIVLLALGIMSIYLSRMFLETQNRPFVIIDEYLEKTGE